MLHPSNETRIVGFVSQTNLIKKAVWETAPTVNSGDCPTYSRQTGYLNL